MQKEEMFVAIGRYFGETEITELMQKLDLIGKPKRKRGEDDAYVMAPDIGIELGFTDEEALEPPLLDAREYPDGALVLTNVEFFGRRSGNYIPHSGNLPDGLIFGMTKQEVQNLFGAPHKMYLGEDVFKWICDERALICTFESDSLAHVSYQVVLEDDLPNASD